MKGIRFLEYRDPFVYEDYYLHPNKHTWTDWGLILKEKPDIAFPEVKTKYVEIDGADGQIDLTGILGGIVNYNDRMGSLTFVKVGNRDGWTSMKSKIANYLHGRKMQMILDEDKGYFYVGRFFLNEWTSDKKTGELVIDYELEPYKFNVLTSIDNWLWDTFNFETGVIRDLKNIPIVPNTVVQIPRVIRRLVPTLTVITEGQTGFHVVGKYGVYGIYSEFDLPDGTYKDPKLIFKDTQTYTFLSGTGTITIDFRDGSL